MSLWAVRGKGLFRVRGGSDLRAALLLWCRLAAPRRATRCLCVGGRTVMYTCRVRRRAGCARPPLLLCRCEGGYGCAAERCHRCGSVSVARAGLVGDARGGGAMTAGL